MTYFFFYSEKQHELNLSMNIEDTFVFDGIHWVKFTEMYVVKASDYDDAILVYQSENTPKIRIGKGIHFDVGDKVRVLTIQEMLDKPFAFLGMNGVEASSWTSSVSFLATMEKFCGKEYTINAVIGREQPYTSYYFLDEIPMKNWYGFADYMLELVKKAEPKITRHIDGEQEPEWEAVAPPNGLTKVKAILDVFADRAKEVVCNLTKNLNGSALAAVGAENAIDEIRDDLVAKLGEEFQ